MKTLDEIRVWSVNTHRIWAGYENGKNAALEDCPTDFLEHNEAIEVVKLSDVKLRDSNHQKIITDLVSALQEIVDRKGMGVIRNAEMIATEALAAYKQIETKEQG